ncbi:MAG: alpha/beta hydrolase [Ornithinimicrobium sp.]
MNTTSAPATLYLERPGGRIAFDISGPESGHLVVCLPGMGDLRSTYRHLRVGLTAAGCRVAVMDLRGHGDSDASFEAYDDEAAAADAIALIEALGGSGVVVGSSMGAGAAVVAAQARPDLVNGLVLIGPFVRNVPMPAIMRWAFRLAMGGPWSTRVWLSYLPTLYPSRRGEEFEEHRRDIAAAMRRPGRAAAFRRTTRTDHAPAWRAAQRVSAPTFILMGSEDPDFGDPAGEAELIARTVGGTAVMIPGAGHYPQMEFPDVTTPAIVDFVTETMHHA